MALLLEIDKRMSSPVWRNTKLLEAIKMNGLRNSYPDLST